MACSIRQTNNLARLDNRIALEIEDVVVEI